jgi:hypothetical protein
LKGFLTLTIGVSSINMIHLAISWQRHRHV